MRSAFTSRAQTYRSLTHELEAWIRKRYAIQHGSVAATRKRKPNGEYPEWRVVAYWHEEGVMRGKVLGKLRDIMNQAAHLELTID